MPRVRRTVHPTLRKYFIGLRETRGWSQQQAASMAERRGVKLSYQALRGLESGETRYPSPELLRAVAALYDVSYSDVLSEYVGHAYGLPIAARGEQLEFPADEESPEQAFRRVPLLSGRIAAGPPLVVDEREVADHLAFAVSMISNLGVTKPICVRVGRYERSMLPTIRPGDTVLLDCADAKRETPRRDRIYAVNVEEGSTLKRVILAGGMLTLVSDNLDKDEYPARTIECDSDTELRSLIVGEAVWCGTML